MHVDAYIDYGSPYSYLAWFRVTQHPDRFPGGRFEWKPVSAGHIFAKDGTRPNASFPNLLAYNKADVARWARAVDAPYRMNRVFPQRTIEASRVFYHLAAKDPKKAAAWTARCFHAHWAEDEDLSDAATLAALAAPFGVDDLAAATGDASAKQRLIEATDAAYAAGAPGVPYFVIGEDGYWGNDRLDWVAARLRGDDAPRLP